MARGEPLNLSELTLSAHAGTHVDAPYHFLRDGRTVDGLPVDAYSGPAAVLDLRGVGEAVTARDLADGEVRRGDVVLLRTRNSDRLGEPTFFEDYVYLREDGARLLVDRGAKAVGIDSLSVEGFRVEGAPTHRTLLGAGVGIVEGLDLSHVGEGRYTFLCFPLRVVGGDGAPARAVLVEGGDPDP